MRQHSRAASSLVVEVHFLEQENERKIRARHFAQARDVSFAGLKLRFAPIDQTLTDDLENKRVRIQLTVHPSAQEQLSLFGEMRWLKHDVNGTTMGLSYVGHREDAKKLVEWATPKKRPGRYLRLLLPALALLLLVQSLRFFFTPGTKERVLIEQLGEAQPQTQNRSYPSVAQQSARAAVAPQKATAAPRDDYDPFETWMRIDQLHNSRPPAATEWKSTSEATIQNYFISLNQAIDENADYRKFRSTLAYVNCRSDSCVVELEVMSFPLAAGLVEMIKNDTLYARFGVALEFECPLASVALPLVYEAEQSPFPILLHYRCNPPAPPPDQ